MTPPCLARDACHLRPGAVRRQQRCVTSTRTAATIPRRRTGWQDRGCGGAHTRCRIECEGNVMPVKWIIADIDGCISPEESVPWDLDLFIQFARLSQAASRGQGPTA